MKDRLEQVVEAYFTAVRDVYRLGAGTKERSYYPALHALLADIGGLLRPKVLCLSDLGNTGAGHPDFGLFAANQVQKGAPRKGQVPERGVVEVKSVQDDAWLTAGTAQVTKYFGAYRLVIVSNIRDFLIVGEGPSGAAEKLESFRLAPDAGSFWKLISTPEKSAKHVGKAFGEYLRRALSQSVALQEPKDVAWFLASYARDAYSRVREAGDLPALKTVRGALEDALGVKFTAEEGEHFFQSTLVQTLFYGVFSAWVLWARETPPSMPRFEWEKAIWHLNVPFVRELFQQLSDPKRLKELQLVEVLNWTAATLNRVNFSEFFKRFKDAEAVQYFYEPFLEAFDPELRRALGVWYTPPEVVSYMVERVDKALREDLGVADGFASEQVIVLDPCCGTGTYLAAVLGKIDQNLAGKGLGALKGEKVKQAALTRVFGFEIMPAPFIVAHLQIGLALRNLNANLNADTDRAGVYLTNALTGWEPTVEKPLPFPELEEERHKADQVKQLAPILVILGNPPYNGFAGMAVSEERALSLSYRTTKLVRKPQGQGLNDLYVRFFRMAERRIAEKTGRGIVSFISNYSWLDGLSFTGMRERFLEAFDTIRIDSLNGDKYRTGKTTPDGGPDPSIFSTEHNREGIQVGTAIATLVRKPEHSATTEICFRSIWGIQKRQELLDTANADSMFLYTTISPALELGLPFLSVLGTAEYFKWPALTDLLPVSFPGVKTSRDDFLVDIDLESLKTRIRMYFDSSISDDGIRSSYPTVMKPSDRFEPIEVRQSLLKRGLLEGNFVKYAYRPFDVRWLYWESETKLLDEKREEYWPHAYEGNLTLSAQQKPRGDWQSSQVVQVLPCLDLIDRGSSNFPIMLVEPGTGVKRPNLSQSVANFLVARALPQNTIFFHVVAVLHAPIYRVENADALRMDWPRIPLPADASVLSASGKIGGFVASLLNSETQVSGVTFGSLRPIVQTLGVATTRGGRPFDEPLRRVTAGWGREQIAKHGPITMPGRGLVVERPYSSHELASIDEEAALLGCSRDSVLGLLGPQTLDVKLNEDAWWSNIPTKVWDYTLGNYQVVKKWLSYREYDVLHRPVTVDEIEYLAEMVRRIAAILLCGAELDKNYEAAKANAVEWTGGKLI